jgi:hypothetical protein
MLHLAHGMSVHVWWHWTKSLPCEILRRDTASAILDDSAFRADQFHR